MTDSDHVRTELQAMGHMTFQQWFNGRADFVRRHQPVAADLGEQAMRADYIADKAWWYRRYQPQQYADLAQAVAAAASELPTPAGVSRSMRRGWLEQIDMAITAAARQIPSHQWATTLIPQQILQRISESAL